MWSKTVQGSPNFSCGFANLKFQKGLFLGHPVLRQQCCQLINTMIGLLTPCLQKERVGCYTMYDIVKIANICHIVNIVNIVNICQQS